MASISIPIDSITSRLNLSERLQGFNTGALTNKFGGLRPIGEFLDFKRLSKPADFSDAQSRANYNLTHYSSNYLAVFIILSIYALITNLTLCFVIFLVVAGRFFISLLGGQDLVVGNFRATTSQLYTGLFVVAIPLGLYASPIGTALWLVGASGATILGHAIFMDKPIDEAFSGEAELDTDEEDSDTQGVGLVVRRGTRFVSDELKFTGTDLGGRAGGALRRRLGQGEPGSEDEDDDTDSEGPDIDEMDLALMSPMEKEELLVQSAMARIQRARERGSSDVNLSKLELEALEARRTREAEEAAAEKKARKKKRDQRVAIPLTHLDPVSRKKSSGSSKSQLSSRHQSATDLQVLPPVGHFPPPSGSRSRPRSGTAASTRPSTRDYDERPSSPFQHEQGQRPGSRHASDSLSRSRSSRYYDDGAASSSSSSRTNLDPFQFQTEGPRATRSSGAAASSKRHTMPPPESPYRTRSGRARGAVRRSPSSDDSSDEGSVASDESTDDYGSGARVKTTPPGRKSSAIVVEESPERDPEPEPEPVKKKSSSPAKRKPVASRVRRSKKK